MEQYYEGLNVKLAELVSSGSERVLEVGCGAGMLGRHLREIKPGREVYGIEIVEEVARQAQKHLDGVVIGDLESLTELPFPKGHFDVITFGDVLEHLVDPEAVLRRMLGYLADRGEIVCCLPNVSHWSIIVELLRGRFTYADNGLLDRTHLRFFTPESFKELLVSSGYEVVEEELIRVERDSVTTVLATAADQLGLDPEVVKEAASTYQMLFRARAAGTRPAVQDNTTVVVVTYNSAATIVDCLGSLATTGVSDVVVVDNASHDETVELVKAYADVNPFVRLVTNATNLGFSAATNLGAASSTREYLVLLNPDTVVTYDWLPRMHRFLEASPRVAAVGPTSNYVAGHQQARLYVDPSLVSSASAETIAATLASTRNGMGVRTKLLIGFCLMMRRRDFEDIGRLDPELFLGNDDLDLSWRLGLQGKELVVATDSFVHHVGQVSFDTVPKETTARLVQESSDALARKLLRHYGPGQVPSATELWDIGWFAPSFELWPEEVLTFISVPDWHDQAQLAALVREYVEVVPECAPVSLVLGLPAAAGLGADDAYSGLLSALEAAGLDPDAVPDIAVTPYADDPSVLMHPGALVILPWPSTLPSGVSTVVRPLSTASLLGTSFAASLP